MLYYWAARERWRVNLGLAGEIRLKGGAAPVKKRKEVDLHSLKRKVKAPVMHSAQSRF